jgi:hypothetical protein
MKVRMHLALLAVPGVLCLYGKDPVASSLESHRKDLVGTWEFMESWPRLDGEGTNVVTYSFKVSDIRGVLSGELDIDGFQTSTHVRCLFKPQGDRFEVSYSGRKKDHAWPNFKPGDLLFSMRPSQVGFITIWGKVDSTLEENGKPARYFIKEKQP